MQVLVIDVGGTHVKLMRTGSTETRKFTSGDGFTPRQVVTGTQAHTADWTFDAVTIGIPSPVIRGVVVQEPWNLGTGWVTRLLKMRFAATSVGRRPGRG